ncbi:MAG: hypothetical protein C7B46_20715 [Sulfobacillus benefaciens]|uniref:Uncharacterized protein n=1 Tax=Sulfobacillus benefaciens TaxID=453960 RepID=A0A2T2WSS1_9FIRM|nr:MAG: hypothetical protein C7B46_20715 [Sulfobacillus benefaciens]
MTKVGRKILGTIIAGSFIAFSGVAFAHGHQGGRDHNQHGVKYQVIQGVFESGSLTGPAITAKTNKGQTITIDMRSSTKIGVEAEGTVATIMQALDNHQLRVTALVQPNGQSFWAIKIEAHLNTKGNDHRDKHSKHEAKGKSAAKHG